MFPPNRDELPDDEPPNIPDEDDWLFSPPPNTDDVCPPDPPKSPLL